MFICGFINRSGAILTGLGNKKTIVSCEKNMGNGILLKLSQREM